MARSEIFIDVETGTLLDSFDSTLSAPNQSFTYGDAIDLQVTGVRKNQGVDSADVPWSVIDMTGKDFRVAIGTLDRLPFAGDFTVNASTSIDYNATEAEVDAALNADATITAEGGVTVSALAAGGWRVTFVTDGAKTALAGNENTLLPSSSIYLDLQRAGDTNVQEVWMMRIETNPSAYSQLTDAIPAPTVAIEQVRNGDSGNNISEVQAVTMTGTATGGTYALTLDGVATGEIAYNADSVAIEDAIASLPIVGGDTDLITISGDSQAFTVSFDSTLGDLSNLLVDDSNLVGLTGKAGNLNINTVEIIELLNGSQSQQAFFEVVLYDTDNSQGQTVSLSTVAVIQDIIPDSPPSVTPVVEYADKIHTHPISDVTNLQSELSTLSGDITTIEARLAPLEAFAQTSNITYLGWADGTVDAFNVTDFNGSSGIFGVTPQDRDDLRTIRFGEGVETISRLRNCDFITSIHWPSSLRTIEAWAFDSTEFPSTILPEGLLTIEQDAFNNAHFSVLEVPSTVTSIGDQAFKDNSHLTAVTFRDTAIALQGYTFKNCTALETVDLGNAITAIGVEEFRGCDALHTIAIPASCVSMGQSAFYSCDVLATVPWSPSACDYGDSCFKLFGVTGTVTVPANATLGIEVFEGCLGITNVIWEEGCTNTGDFLLSNIGSSASTFQDCTNLTHTTIPDSIVTLCYETYYRCNLTDIVWPSVQGSNLTTIQNYCFQEAVATDYTVDCVLPDSLTTVQGSALDSKWKDIYFSGSATVIGGNVGQGNGADKMYVALAHAAGYGGIDSVYNGYIVKEWTSYPALMS